MRGALSKTIRIIALLATLCAIAASHGGCGGEAAVTVVPQPTPTRTPEPDEE